MDPITPAQAAELIRSTDSLGVPLGPGVPGAFIHALDARDSYDDLQISGALLPDLYGVFMKPGVHYRTGFLGPAERFMIAGGADIEFVPADFRRFAPILANIAPRVMATAAAEPDEDGWISLSVHAGATVKEIHSAAADPDRVCLVEVSPHFPRTLGLEPDHMNRIHVDDVDVLVQSDATPFNLADGEPSEAEQKIAELAAALIPNGATIQTGIGGVPNAVASLLANGDGGGYGVHSEMFTTGLMRLHQSGKVDNLNKGIFDGVSITTFAAGTAELYEWLERNSDVRFLPVDVVNSPELIGKNNHMVTINGALSVDLSGQVIADTIGGKQFSGIGGHEDFIAGTGLESSDRSLICLPSTTTIDGITVSRIAAKAAEGSIITTPRHQIDLVITEFGVAELGGRSVRERARALAAIAHPDFREKLLAEAELWP